MLETATLGRPRTIDWPPIREAFISRTPTPSYTELSAEFAVSVQSVSRTANEENWSEMRLGRIKQQLQEAGANEIILAAIQSEGEVTQRARQFVIDFIGTGEALRQALLEDESLKASSRISSLNNLGFAFANIGRFVESIASLSLSGKLTRAQKNGSSEANGGQPWEKGMLQQINVTVKNIQASAEAASKAAEPAIEAEPAP